MRGNVLRNRSGGTPEQHSSPGIEHRKIVMARMQATTSTNMSSGSKAPLEVENINGKDEEQNGNELYVQ